MAYFFRILWLVYWLFKLFGGRVSQKKQKQKKQTQKKVNNYYTFTWCMIRALCLLCLSYLLNLLTFWCNIPISLHLHFVLLIMLIICADLLRKKRWRVDRETMRALVSQRIDKDKLKPGDHIYSWRNWYIYGHHGIYGRDGEVIHLSRGGGPKFDTETIIDPSPSHLKDNPMNPCSACDFQSDRGGIRVISSCMNCFLSGGDLYLFHYDVSVAFFVAKLRGGTCTIAPSDPPEKVLHRAESLLSKDTETEIRNGFTIYNLGLNNCEDFAIYCKTGPRVCNVISPDIYRKMDPRDRSTMSVRSSGQTMSFYAAVIAVFSSLLHDKGFPRLVMYFAGYTLGRLLSDVGIRLECDKLIRRKSRFFSPFGSEE